MSSRFPSKETFNSCWVGPRLLPIANACINSFDAYGYPFRLYTYGATEGIPSFVERADASSLAREDEVFVAHGGLETFADLFAYRFLARVGGWWVDNDVVCNADAIPDVEIAFAEERPGIINNAVLKFPPNHPAIADLLSYVATVDARRAPWGATGPRALSEVLRRHDLARYARPPAECYPLHWKDAPLLLFPEFTDEVLERTARSPFIHLWGSTLRELGFDFSRSRPLAGSYLDRLYTQHLDPAFADRLERLDERAFRCSVQEYVAKHWGVSLSLA